MLSVIRRGSGRATSPITFRPKVVSMLEDGLEIHREVRPSPLGAAVEFRPLLESGESRVPHREQGSAIPRFDGKREHGALQLHPRPRPRKGNPLTVAEIYDRPRVGRPVVPRE